MTRPIVRSDWLTRTTKQRFDEKWIPEPNSGCWLWTATSNKQGYGGFMLNGKREHAQRVAWFLKHGQMPPIGIDVCHRCDTPACVNPDHLFLGTRSDNMRDAISKGRRVYQIGCGTKWKQIRKPANPDHRLICKYGHELNDATIYVSREGHVSCRECRRRSAWKYRAKL